MIELDKIKRIYNPVNFISVFFMEISAVKKYASMFSVNTQ